jgi:hypothetical protein
LIAAIGWPAVLHALAQNAFAHARDVAADNAHAAVGALRLGCTLAELGRYANRERV